MIDQVWLIPALPLASFIIIVAFTRVMDVRSRRAAGVPAGATDIGHPAGLTHEEAASADRGPTDEPGAPPGGHDVDTLRAAHGGHGPTGASLHEDEAHDAHSAHGTGEHGGETPFWAKMSAWVGIAAIVVAWVISVIILIQFITGSSSLQANGETIKLYTWFSFGPNTYPIDFHVDSLTALMLVVVTTVSMLVQIYSQGYMQGDPGFSRFFAWLSLFTVSMLILVLADNFLVIYIGWELVGLCSYLLIGFWYERNDPPPAALKAFVTTRFGDFGFLIGILILFFNFHTFSFSAISANAGHIDIALLTLAMILIFCGAVGKSAQFPLHTWLPDAMEGPTPVSALIHAATMVAAGVYLVARTFTIFHQAGPEAFEVVAYVGGFTAIFAASIGLVQNDIKRVLAYSTISQLGYMFVGLGVGPTDANGMFHLFTHAFFKALLFLGSGCVIHSIANQDMRKMGGLAPYMKWTAGCFLIATLSISGIPPLAGFFSKDGIIGEAYTYGTAHGGNYVLYALTLVTAGLTSFYMFRLWFLTFGGRGGKVGGFWGGEYRGEGTAHKVPFVMWGPLVALAIPSALAGFWGLGNFPAFLTGNPAAEAFENPFTSGLTWVGVAVALAGIGVAWLMYGFQAVPADALTRNPVGAFVYRVLLNKYYVDEFYGWIIRNIVLGLSYVEQAFDRYVIDGVVNGSVVVIRSGANIFRRTETGRVQNYAAAIFGGALIIVLIVFIVVQAGK
ncbi:MAG TPA: NADH-quinone oxidoreductase subunit L [Ktedonobacterales bacterium]|nr:NADH-quinone oxidoreductase subunit L [Ktedonobacterales bacterium]